MSANGNETPPDPLAEPSDVRQLIATNLDDPTVNGFLDDAAFANWRANDIEAMGDPTRKRLEAALAAYDIRATRDRSIASGDRQSASLEYDGSALDELRRKVRDLDPSGDLVGDVNTTRRTAGEVASGRPHSRDGIGDRGPPRGYRER
jgi:hypothetical protein